MWYLFLFILGWLLWRAWNARYRFYVTVEGQRTRVLKGQVSSRFLEAIEQTCQEHRLQHCRVWGIRGSHGTRLCFGQEVPRLARQQLRSWWHQFGSPIR